MQKLFLMSLIVMFLFGVSNTVNAVDDASFRCGNLFVKKGVSGPVVEYNCGEPVKKEYVGMSERKNTLEKWYYGPIAGYMYILTLSAGNVLKIESFRP
jgi:hypothetical protein